MKSSHHTILLPYRQRLRQGKKHTVTYELPVAGNSAFMRQHVKGIGKPENSFRTYHER